MYAMSNPPESNSALHNHLDCDNEDRRYYTNDPDLFDQAEKGQCQISSTI
jgi:hypothetical protein